MVSPILEKYPKKELTGCMLWVPKNMRVSNPTFDFGKEKEDENVAPKIEKNCDCMRRFTI